jgi:hypothetical protein
MKNSAPQAFSLERHAVRLMILLHVVFNFGARRYFPFCMQCENIDFGEGDEFNASIIASSLCR